MKLYETEFGSMAVEADELGRGGRGRVRGVLMAPDGLGVSAEELVVKEVEALWRTPGRKEKVRCLARMGRELAAASASGMDSGSGPAASAKGLPAGCAVAWPVAEVFDGGEWVGFAMRRMAGRSLCEIKADATVPMAAKVRLARRMCELVCAMHRLGIVVGDLSLSNFVFDEARDVLALIDVDSAQVLDVASGSIYPTVESRERSPAMLGGRLGDVVLTSRSDDFLIGIEVFRMLFDVHPLDEPGAPLPPAQQRLENVRKRRFGFAQAAHCCGADAFGDDLARLLAATFEGDVDQMPTAGAYARCLAKLEKATLAECPVCGAVCVQPAERGLGAPFAAAIGKLNEVASDCPSARRRVPALKVGLAAAAFSLAVFGCACSSEAMQSVASAADSAREWVVSMGGGVDATGAVDGLAAKASNAIERTKDFLADTSEVAFSGLASARAFASEAADVACALASDAWDVASEEVPKALEIAGAWASDAFEWVCDVASNVAGWVSDVVSGL